MYFLLNMGIFQPAILVYQRVPLSETALTQRNERLSSTQNTEAWEFLEVGVPHQAALKIWKVGEDVNQTRLGGFKAKSSLKLT